MPLKKKLILAVLLILPPIFWYQLNSVSAPATFEISQHKYQQKLQGFWLGQNIGNWTGLITEMDKVGTPQTLPFYTDKDWGSNDLVAMWGEYVPHASQIDFYFQPYGSPWGLMTIQISNICIFISMIR